MQTAWGWALPTAAVILTIIVISLLLEMRPRKVVPSVEDTSTTQPTRTGTPTPLSLAIPTPAITVTIVSPTPTLSPATPASTEEALLVELYRLNELRRPNLLTGPGWIYVESDRANTEQGGKMLPNGRQVPPQWMEYSWYQVDEQGNVLATITRQIDYSDQIYQEIVTQDGISRNMTFSFANAVTVTTAYEPDWGFADAVTQALARGASLSQVENDEGKFVLLLEEADPHRGGKLQRYAAFDPQTGRLFELSTWLDVPCGESELDCGNGLMESMTLMIEQRVDQPPADALALLSQPLPEYQPVPPQGETVPADFDLAHSILSFQTFAGDDFNHPGFWYGDIYADSSYLVGRVDFGAIPGGFCQRSPDGLKLAFDRATLPSGAPATHQLRWLELNNPADVHSTPVSLQLISPPVWNPGSDNLAFIACDANQYCRLHTYNTLTSVLKGLADGGNATPPVWSPDGTQIAYQTGTGESPQTVVVDAISGSAIASPVWQPQFLADWSGFSQCELTTALAPTLPTAPADWLAYTNAVYGFSFRYPSDATLEETSNTVLLTQYDGQGGVLALNIGFMRVGEPVKIPNGWLNMGDMGDLVHDGHVSLLGQSLTRHVLVYEGKVKVVLYGQADRDGMIFSFRLDDTGQNYDVLDLSAEFQQQVNQIFESFAWITEGAQSVTPTRPTVTPAPGSQALLDELQSLVRRRTTALLVSPGWIHLHTLLTNPANCGTLLPNGASIPCEIEDVSWYELDARGQVVTVITRQVNDSGFNLEQVTRDGLARNLTFGYETTVPLTSTYVPDQGFAAEAAQALARGASLSRASSSIDGEYLNGLILLLVEGNMQCEAVFDPLTGGLLALSTWKWEQDQFGEGLTLIANVKVYEEVWVEQPTEYGLSLLDQPTPPYQPLPPQGELVPVGFDLAHSILTFQTLAGDDFFHPTFSYGDIYADNSYLVGRVDFGAIPGGFCQRSPDGQKLAFDRATLSSDTSTTHQLRWLALSSPADVHAVLPELQLASPPVWGPDSVRLAFIACDADFDCGLYSYDVTSQALLHLGDGGNATPPVWSPDGAQVAYEVGMDVYTGTVVVDAATGVAVDSPDWQPKFLKDWSGYSQCEQPPALSPAQPTAPADWLTYTNAAYGFSFRYSPDWTLQEQTQTVQLKQSDVTFTISFRRPEEPSTYLRTGMPAGDFLHGGHVSFFGQSLPRYLLWYEGKVKVIVHSMGNSISRRGILFVLSLDDFSQDYDAVDFSAELQQQVNQIIESFQWIGP